MWEQRAASANPAHIAVGRKAVYVVHGGTVSKWSLTSLLQYNNPRPRCLVRSTFQHVGSNTTDHDLSPVSLPVPAA